MSGTQVRAMFQELALRDAAPSTVLTSRERALRVSAVKNTFDNLNTFGRVDSAGPGASGAGKTTDVAAARGAEDPGRAARGRGRARGRGTGRGRARRRGGPPRAG